MTVPLRFYLYAAAIAVIVSGLLWYRHSLIAEGENNMKIAQQEAANEQAGKDAKTSEETVSGLKTEIAGLRERAAQPAPVVRLCTTPSRVRAAPVAAGAATRSPATGDVPVVSEGDRAGPDVGAGLQQFAEAADIMSARDRACLKWARGIAK